MCCGKRYEFGAAMAEPAEDADEDAEDRRVGQEDNVCGPNTNTDGSNAGYTGAFDIKFIHVCDGAIRFAASVAAAGVAAYYM